MPITRSYWAKGGIHPGQAISSSISPLYRTFEMVLISQTHSYWQFGVASVDLWKLMKLKCINIWGAWGENRRTWRKPHASSEHWNSPQKGHRRESNKRSCHEATLQLTAPPRRLNRICILLTKQNNLTFCVKLLGFFAHTPVLKTILKMFLPVASWLWQKSCWIVCDGKNPECWWFLCLRILQCDMYLKKRIYSFFLWRGIVI